MGVFPHLEVVMTFDVLHDAPNPAELITQVKAALRPEGTWLLADIASEHGIRANVKSNAAAATMFNADRVEPSGHWHSLRLSLGEARLFRATNTLDQPGTAFSVDYAPGHLCVARNRHYAAVHGYRFRCWVDSNIAMAETIAGCPALTWCKVHAIIEALRRAPPNGLVLWIDADALVVRMEVTLEAVLDAHGEPDLLIEIGRAHV